MNNFKESGEGSNVIRVYLIWGLGLQDRRKCHFTDYKCRGETIFDEDFDLNAPNCQISVLVGGCTCISWYRIFKYQY